MDADLFDAVAGQLEVALGAVGHRALSEWEGEAPGDDGAVGLGRRLLARLCRRDASGKAARAQLEAAAADVAAAPADEGFRTALRCQVEYALAGADGVEDDALVAELRGLLEAADVRASGAGSVVVGRSTGIISTGPGAINTVNVNQYRLPEAGLRAAGAVESAPRTIRLGPYTAGRLFVGRDEELEELDLALAEGSAVIVTGLGGVGKSTLAHRYAETHRDRYNPVWWIDAEEKTGIESGLAALARRLSPELAHLPDLEAATWGRSWLSSHDGWMVILDNATDPAHIAALVGDAGNGRFLLTSRLTTGWEELAAPVPLGVLATDQARELMARGVGHREKLLDGAEALCEALGHLPLAIRLAAAYMLENDISAAGYLDRLADPDGEVIAWTPTAGNPEHTVARIWLVSLRRITDAHGTLALELLRILAWLAPTDIPVSLLYGGLPGRSSDAIDEALGRLYAYTLITRGGDALTVHRLVQAAARFTAGKEPVLARDVEAARGSAVDLLSAATPSAHDPEGWPLWRRLLPHLDALAARTDPSRDDAAMLALLDHEGHYLRRHRQVARAIPLFERVVAGAPRCFGQDHPTTLTFRNDLAVAFRVAGDQRRAIALHQQILVDRERILGLEHPDTLASRHNLAFAYRSSGDLRHAIRLFEQTVSDRERILGPDHPDTLDSRNDLGGAYRMAGDLRRAIPLYRATLADRERVLGPVHPDTLTSRSNLAYAYRLSGDLRRAIPLYEQTLDERERVLGPEHPETLLSRNNLAYAYGAAGDLPRSIELYEQTLNDRSRILGSEHLDTLTARSNLAGAYRKGGDPRRAIPLLEQTLADRERILGPEHPSTFVSRGSLAGAYLEVGELRQGTELHERNLADRERILGPEHPNTLLSRNSLARAHQAVGDLASAIPLFVQAFTDRERVLGPEHPDTLTSRDDLAGAYLAVGELRRAIELHERNLADRERILGPEHPDTVESRNNLARAYRAAGGPL